MTLPPLDVVSAGHLALAMELADRCLGAGDPPFGAVLTGDGRILTTGSNATVSAGDPLRHAELDAITHYIAQTGRSRESGTRLTLFCSTEPCLMCMGALYWAGVRHVVFAGSQEALCRLRGHGVFLTAGERRAKFPDIGFAGPMLASQASEQWQRFYGTNSVHPAGVRT